MKIKVMTFNLRCKNGGDGINCFDNREPKVLAAINNELPDLVGFQEATDYQRDFLRKNISDKYIVVGCGRGSNYYGEAVCIAFKRDIFELVSLETFWLSDSPTVPGSVYENSDQSSCPRFTVHAELISKDLSSPIHFFNTHLDHLGSDARLRGIEQIIKEIAKCGSSFILTGDFNALPDSNVIERLNSVKDFTCTEATRSITHTFHAFGRIERDHKIDYIFTSGTPLACNVTELCADDGIFISDHHPVCATIEI